MKSSPRRTALAIADAMFEGTGGPSQIGAMVDEVFVFVGDASLASRVTLRAALLLLRFAPLLLRESYKPLERLDRQRRAAVLARVERSPIGLALVAWRTLLVLHFYEDARELARIGYVPERRRHLAVVPPPLESGVRLRGDVDGPGARTSTGELAATGETLSVGDERAMNERADAGELAATGETLSVGDERAMNERADVGPQAKGAA